MVAERLAAQEETQAKSTQTLSTKVTVGAVQEKSVDTSSMEPPPAAIHPHQAQYEREKLDTEAISDSIRLSSFKKTLTQLQSSQS